MTRNGQFNRMYTGLIYTSLLRRYFITMSVEPKTLAVLSEKDQLRYAESLRLKSMIGVMSSTRATVDLLMGIDLASVKKNKERITDYLSHCPRRGLLESAVEIDELVSYLNDNYLLKKVPEESGFAYQLRKLDILSRILQNNIAEGQEALNVVNILMEETVLDIDNMDIARKE